jgi:hypothetical protein
MPDAPSTLCGPLPIHLSVTQRSHRTFLLVVLTVHSLRRSFYVPFLVTLFPALYLTKICLFVIFLPPVCLIRPLDVLLL